MSIITEFLDFIEREPKQSVPRLLDRLLWKCRELTRAEAGTIYILRKGRGERLLEASSSQNDAVRAKSVRYKVPVNPHSIAGYVATTGETVFLDDVRDIGPNWPFTFNSSFDDRTGFRTKSMLCFALENYHHEVIGVVQLINCRDHAAGQVVPFDPAFRNAIATVSQVLGRAIERADAMERISESNRKLRERNRALRQQREQIVELQKETERALLVSVELLARAAELHDEETGNHILRVNEYSYALAKFFGMPQAYCDEIRYSAALHDVGKMSVDIAVLHKKGRLEPHEMAEIKRHPVYGYQILSRSDRLSMAADIAHAHHEKWDGTGYPNGLKGEEIPLAARIVSIADIYDALRSERPYKPGFSHEKSVDIILNGDDRIDPRSHFDPKLLAVFAKHNLAFAEIWDRLIDQPGAKVAEAVNG